MAGRALGSCSGQKLDIAEASGEGSDTGLWRSCWKVSTRLQASRFQKGRVKISPGISQKLDDQKKAPMTKQDA